MRAAWRQVLSALVFGGVWACSLAVDTEELDQDCPAGQKQCGPGLCVPESTPAYGCSPDVCDPCDLENAVPRCDGTRCVVDHCTFGFGCLDNALGCLVNVQVDRNNCGRCGRTCHAPCREGVCIVSECEAGYDDCDGNAENGCETALGSATTCPT